MRTVTLDQPDDFDGWRDAARALALAHVPPDRAIWQVGSSGDLFASDDSLPAATAPLTVPKAFVDLARTVVCHDDPERFALLYVTAGDPPLKRVAEAVERTRKLDERGRPIRAMAQRISDWRRGRNVPARFAALSRAFSKAGIL